jgi:hypothetical protein
VTVGSRVFRAGFTGTRRLPVSAVPSAGVGGPASMLGGPGVEVTLVVVFAPASEIYRGVEVTVNGVSASASEHPVGKCELIVDFAAPLGQRRFHNV